jgi:hypothetical protein
LNAKAPAHAVMKRDLKLQKANQKRFAAILFQAAPGKYTTKPARKVTHTLSL